MLSGIVTGGDMETELEMMRLCLGIGNGGSGGGGHENEGRPVINDGGAAARCDKQASAGCVRRKKHWLKREQAALLEASFRRHTILPQGVKQDLVRQLRLQPQKVGVWFQNRRARYKLKQMELECDLLRQHCDRLTAQNARLQQEITEAYYCFAWPAVPPSTAAAAMVWEAAAAGPSSSGAAKIIVELDSSVTAYPENLERQHL